MTWLGPFAVGTLCGMVFGFVLAFMVLVGEGKPE